MGNAIEFISAYNEIDARLRALYRGKGNLQFSDLVRRSAQFNATVKRYEEELLSFARLRNAIVHESTREKIIAEPCDEATATIKHIASLLSAPPMLREITGKEPTCIAAGASLKKAIVTISNSGYSNLPVLRGGRTVGVLNNRRIVRAVGRALERGEDLNDFLEKRCDSVISEADMCTYYKVLSGTESVQDAIDAFSENRRLLAVLVTSGEGEIVNILTPSDLPRLMRMLEE